MGNTVVMEITTKQGYIVLIDDEDITKANNGKSLHVKQNGFVIISKRFKRKIIHLYLHKEILGIGKGMQVDHINHNRLDNRKNNLRLSTHHQNQMNKKPRKILTWDRPYKGVQRKMARLGYWRYFAVLTLKSKKYRGKFRDTPEEAARDYDILAKLHFGAFAWLNFPNE